MPRRKEHPSAILARLEEEEKQKEMLGYVSLQTMFLVYVPGYLSLKHFSIYFCESNSSNLPSFLKPETCRELLQGSSLHTLLVSHNHLIIVSF